MNTIEQVVMYWKSQSLLQLRSGLRPETIDAFCAKKAFQLPVAMRKLLEEVDGFAPPNDQDDRGFSFWPLARMSRVDEYDRGAHGFPGSHDYLLFCDYLSWSWAYAIRVESSESEQIGAVIMVGTSDGRPFKIADTFESFLDAYVEDRSVLYGD